MIAESLIIARKGRTDILYTRLIKPRSESPFNLANKTTYSRVYAGESLPENSPEREVGKFPITLTKGGITHPLFDHFGTVLEVGHWHNDMPGLAPDAKVIAYSAGCPR